MTHQGEVADYDNLFPEVPTITRPVRPPGPYRPPGPSESTPRQSLRFQPGLEGLRGLAVFGVLLFHGGFTWASGGFLGVSTFFTLSGFLITSLLIKEHESTGTISLRTFWERRFRRLMPASLVCLAGVVFLFAPLVAVGAQLDSLPGDVASSLAYIANWHFIWTGQSYEALFSAPSPVLHFWSLAIEEQFYLLFPLVMTVALVRFALRRHVILWVFGALAVASTLEMAWLYNPSDTSRVYYGTDTRAAELLAGSVLALLLVDRTLLPRAWRIVAIAAGTGAALSVIWLWHITAQTDSWLYRGGFAVYALLSCTVIVAAMQPGVVKVVLANPVFRWLGRISYAAYLLHWPVFLWLTPASTGWNLWPLFVVRLAITFALAEASMRLIEKPVRDRRIMVGWQPLVAAPLAIVLILAMAVHVGNQPRDRSNEIALSATGSPDTDLLTAEEAPTTTTSLLGIGAQTASEPNLPPLLPFASGLDLNVLLEGDSTMVTLGGTNKVERIPAGLTQWGMTTGSMTVTNRARIGCGLARGGRQVFRGFEDTAGNNCADWAEKFVVDLSGVSAEEEPAVDQPSVPEAVVAMFGTWDVVDKRLTPDDRLRWIGDPMYDEFLKREIAEAMDLLASQGSIVIWLTHPQIAGGEAAGLPDDQPEDDPARMARLNDLVREVAASRSRVRVLDLAGYMASRPEGEVDLDERPDGVHWTPRSSDAMAEWLGPQIVDTYTSAWEEIAGEPPPG